MLKPVLLGSAIAITAAQQVRIHRLKKNNRTLVRDHHIMTNVAQFLEKQVNFLANKLDENEVEISEFDKIAFHNL